MSWTKILANVQFFFWSQKTIENASICKTNVETIVYSVYGSIAKHFYVFDSLCFFIYVVMVVSVDAAIFLFCVNQFSYKKFQRSSPFLSFPYIFVTLPFYSFITVPSLSLKALHLPSVLVSSGDRHYVT